MGDAAGEVRGTVFWLACFAAAMGFAEAAVVVYLREFYYPLGFCFPLKALPARLLAVETLREAATLVMLAGAAALSGRDLPRRLAAFLFCFGVWDLFYYAFLKLLLGWPASPLTWDLLFLIPVPWAGPVLAPVICSLTMILLAACVERLRAAGRPALPRRWELALLLAGAALVLYTFVRDYGGLLAAVVPAAYAWPVFLLGELLALAGIALFCRRR